MAHVVCHRTPTRMYLCGAHHTRTHAASDTRAHPHANAHVNIKKCNAGNPIEIDDDDDDDDESGARIVCAAVTNVKAERAR